jgi:hypothetical protein
MSDFESRKNNWCYGRRVHKGSIFPIYQTDDKISNFYFDGGSEGMIRGENGSNFFSQGDVTIWQDIF